VDDFKLPRSCLLDRPAIAVVTDENMAEVRKYMDRIDEEMRRANDFFRQIWWERKFLSTKTLEALVFS